MMNEPWIWILSAAVGAALGMVFFGGLWWTVRKGIASPRPALWFFLSMLTRMAIVLTGFYFIGGGEWQRIAACLLGFILARVLVIRMTRRDAANPEDSSHAP